MTKPTTVRTITWVGAGFDSREPFHVTVVVLLQCRLPVQFLVGIIPPFCDPLPGTDSTQKLTLPAMNSI